MKKYFKYGLLGAGVIVAVVVAGMAYVAVTFNPNDYKAQIINAVKESKQRNLRLDGDIKLSFYPNIGASVSKVTLSEFKSNKKFASIESARAALALIPLLRNQMVVDDVSINGLKATLVRNRDGSTNIDDLLSQPEQKLPPQQQKKSADVSSPIKFNIVSVSVAKTDLGYRDEKSDARYAIKDLNLKTGYLANGAPSKVDFSAEIQSNQPKLDIKALLKAKLTIDPDQQTYHLQDLVVQANGSALDISHLKVLASGNVSADLAKDKYSGDKLKLSANLDASFGNNCGKPFIA